MLRVGIAAAMMLAALPVAAQVRTVDPNSAIDADLAPQGPRPAPAPTPQAPPPAPAPQSAPPPAPAPAAPVAPAGDLPPGSRERALAANEATYARGDVLAAAERVFGRGAEGLAGAIERILSEQGEPNGYIAGREAGGAFMVGVRYGSGILSHKVEGERTVYWTGPSLGFDVGGDAAKVFVLAYNLYDTQELFERFPAAEGRVYFVGGFAVSYLRRGNTVLIPVRLGVGWRLGANLGYMRFSETSRLLPF